MSTTLPPGIQDQRSTRLGWVLASLFLLLFVNIILLPRTPLDQRASLRIFHDSLGLMVAVLAALRLYWFARDPSPRPPAGLPPASFAFNRAILVFLCMTFVAEGVLGFFFAWGEGRDVILFGLKLPALVAKSDLVRLPAGYFHSVFGFYYLMLFALWVAFGVYQNLRYKVGLRRLLPGAAV